MTSVSDYITQNFNPQEMKALSAGLSNHDAQLIADEHNGKISSQDFINKVNPNLLHVLAARQREIDFNNSPQAQSATQKLGQNVPLLGHALADLGTGGTAIVNDARSLVGVKPDNTDYYNTYGVKPNVLDSVASQAIRSIPEMVTPEAAIKNAGAFMNSPTLAGLLSRAGVRGAAGVGANEVLNPNSSNKGEMDAVNGANYAISGAVGDWLPYRAASLINNAAANKLPNEAIAVGNRENLFPDTGNIVGNPKMSEKWNKQTQTLFSPAKEEQEQSYAQVPARQFNNIKDADGKAMSLFDTLRGNADADKIPQSISQDIQDSYNNNVATGNAKYKAIEPQLSKIQLSDAPTIKDAAHGILAQANNASTFGITDPNLKADIVQRAQNAANIQQMPVDQALKESRALSSASADLKGRGQNSAARYYDQLGNAYDNDISSSIKDVDPDTHDALMDANDYWKNNVIPFRAAPTSNKIINNNFDESIAPLNLSNTLTNGNSNQLLSILPSGTKNKVAADLLYKKAFNGLGDSTNPSVSVTNTLASMPQARLSPLLNANPDLQSSLTDIVKTVEPNKEVLNTLDSPTKTISGDELSTSVGSDGRLGFWGHLWNTPGMFTSPYWSRLLSASKTPETLGAIKNGQKIGINDVRNITAPQTLTDSMQRLGLFRAPVISAMSNPSSTRLPVQSLLNNVQEQDNGN